MRSPRIAAPLAIASLLLFAGCGVKSTVDAGGPGVTGSIPDITTTTQVKGSGTGGSSGTLPKRTTTTTGGEATTTTRSSGPTTTAGSGTESVFRTKLIETYQGLGLDEDQATCLTDGIIDGGIVDPSNPSTDDLDFSKISDVLVSCDISPTDFTAGGN